MAHLVIGGTSGLGLQLALHLSEDGSDTIVTGRHDPQLAGVQYEPFDLSAPDLPKRVNDFVASLPTIDTLVYSAGFFQEGVITELSEDQIEDMISVGSRGVIYFLRAILLKQDHLDEFIMITSTSQWTPRKKEPVYNFVKAGEGHFANSIAEDGRVGKVLVAGPAGMDTTFWRHNPEQDRSQMLDVRWVAEQIENLRKDTFRYRFARLMRQPPRVEVVETR